MSYIKLPPKDASEEIIVSLGFGLRLNTSETVTTAASSIEVIDGVDANPSAMLSGSADTTSAPVVAQKIIGGVLGVEYLIKILATTSAGRKIMGARSITIVNGGAV